MQYKLYVMLQNSLWLTLSMIGYLSQPTRSYSYINICFQLDIVIGKINILCLKLANINVDVRVVDRDLIINGVRNEYLHA